MVNELNLMPHNGHPPLKAIAMTMFSDGIISWTRIASLLSFCRVVCMRTQEQHKTKMITRISEELSQYLISAHSDWLECNGWWVSEYTGLSF